WSPTAISRSRSSRRSREKNGRRTRAPAAGRVCPDARLVGPPRVRLTLRRPLDPGVPIAARRAGRASRGGDAPLGGAVSAVWLSPDSDLSEARGPRDEYRSDPPLVAPDRFAG